MTAHEFPSYLQAYCDGELEASKMLEVEEHLHACPSCRQAMEAEQAFREGLRTNIAREPVPPHLVERLRSTIADLDEREASRSPAPLGRAGLGTGGGFGSASHPRRVPRVSDCAVRVRARSSPPGDRTRIGAHEIRSPG